MNTNKQNVVSSFIWKYIERCGYQVGLAVINIILARILSPEYFGELAIINIVVALGQTFVESGLSTALIREKDVNDYDYSNMIIACTGMSFIIYVFIFFLANAFAFFYDMPSLVAQIRIMGIVLIPGALNAVQNSKVVRESLYKSLCFSSLVSVIISGIIGIYAANRGLGTYSLIIQQISYRVLFCVTLLPITHLKLKKPRFDNKFISMFKFGWKLMISSFLNQLYNQVQILVVGKKYDSATLGAYNQGYQYPYLIIANINTSLQTVILPELSKKDNKADIGRVMKKANVLSSYIICPMLIGLAFVSNNFISGVLTDKWLVAMPYLILFCVLNLFIPVSSINLQAYNAINRSDIYLKNEIIKKICGVVLLIFALLLFNTPMAIAVALVITGPLSAVIDSARSGKEFSYSTFKQLGDIFINICASLSMGIVIYFVNYLPISSLQKLLIQVVVGILVYLIISILFNLPGFRLIMQYISFYKNKDK